MSSRSRFTTIYESLPQDAQQSLVYNHLIPLLKAAPKSKSSRALSAAARLRKRHAFIPQLDLRAKKIEVDAMLKELTMDAKRSYVMDTSNRNEILQEVVHSLASWMNDIWSTVYEHNVDYALAHDCLLFVSATLDRLDAIRMGCKCSLNSMYIPVTLRDKKGQTVKNFEVHGALHLEDVALFIWRDMMLSILASGTAKQKALIPKMLADIDGVMGWKCLVRLLYHRPKDTKSRYRAHLDSDSDWEDVENDSDGDDESLPDLASQSDSSESTITEDGFDLGIRRSHHWSESIYAQIPALQRRVEAAMVSVFEASPSISLYSTLLSLAQDSHQLEQRLLASLKEMATSSPETYATALEIYSLEQKVDVVVDLLDSHAYLLRPRDAPALQTAATLLSHHGHSARALQILEAELLDVLRTTRHALLQSFSLLDEPANRDELAQILKMRTGALGRRGRIESWVDAVTTPGADGPNPMMFAALFMGMPGGMPGMNNDDDPYTYLDIEPHDPDLEDLRAEFRPNLKKRFESWADTGLMLKGGQGTLVAVYRKIIESMPFIRAGDITEEMMATLQDRQSKQWVCDGLDALLAFCKVQRRKWHTLKTEAKRKEAKAAAAAGAGPSPSSAAAGPSTSRSAAPPAPRADSPGPPPLIPVASPSRSQPTAATTSAPRRRTVDDDDDLPPLIPAAAAGLAPPPPPAPAPAPTPAIPPAATVLGNELPGALTAEIDAILAAAPPPPPGGHTPVTLMNWIMGVAAAQDEGPRSSIDDVD